MDLDYSRCSLAAGRVVRSTRTSKEGERSARGPPLSDLACRVGHSTGNCILAWVGFPDCSGPLLLFFLPFDPTQLIRWTQRPVSVSAKGFGGKKAEAVC